MLDSMLNVGLSPALTTALYELAINIPSLKNGIADGLLRILSVILMHQAFRHPGTPKRILSPAPPLSRYYVIFNSSQKTDQVSLNGTPCVDIRTTIGQVWAHGL